MSTSNRWSHSSLSTLQACGERYRLRYVEHDYRQSGLKAKRGVAIHETAKEVHKRQMLEMKKWDGATPLITELPGSERSLEEARDFAASAFERAVGEGVSLDSDEKGVGEAVAKAAQKDVAVALAGLYVSDVAPAIVPTAVERKVTIRPKDSDITLVGYIDLVQDDTGEVIRDLKTGEKAPWKDSAKLSQQMTMYALMRMADVGTLPRAQRLVHLVRTPGRHEMSVHVQETTRDLDDISRLVLRINTAVESVKRGVFVPADPAAPGSPCSYCEFADGTCVYVRKRGL
jgi:hypothetical protein